MRQVRVAIEPALLGEHRPEVCWSWRLLLTGIGLPWREVPAGDPSCDIAYVGDPARAGGARLVVLADPERWRRPGLRLGGIAEGVECPHPLYQGESPGAPLVEVVDGRLLCRRDLLFDLFWLVTGQEEAHWPTDRHGHLLFEGAGADPPARRLPRLALASALGVFLEGRLTALGAGPPLARWPRGRRAAACVGHDVDYPEVIRWLEPLRIVRRRGPAGLAAAVAVLTGRRTHWHFDSWAADEKRLETRSAFFFVARRGSLVEYARGTPDPFYDVRSPRFRRLFRRLAGEGFEIGLHASYRAYLGEERLAAEKRRLEEASGVEVAGNRHHYWHLGPRSPESTLRLHERVGLRYDTSLTHERYAGWRRSVSWPFYPFHRGERRQLATLQIQTAWMDDHLFGHRRHNPDPPRELLEGLADTAAEQGGCLLIDVHDYVWDEVLFPGWRSAYLGLWRHLRERSDFWFATPGEVAAHWIERDRLLGERSQGLTG